jgi:hypothetical protein
MGRTRPLCCRLLGGRVVIQLVGQADDGVAVLRRALLIHDRALRHGIIWQGRKSYTTWFDEECVRQIKRLAAEQGVKQQDLAVEAYNLLFAKYHKPEIAS